MSDLDDGFGLLGEDLFAEIEGIEDLEEAGKRKKREKKEYHEAIPRSTSKADATAGHDDLLEGIFDKPSLVSQYVSQQDVLKIKGTNNKSCVSTFTGCGGSDTGFAWAGWNVPFAVEFVKAARETLAANYPGAYIYEPEFAIEAVKSAGLDAPIQPAQTRNRKKAAAGAHIIWEEIDFEERQPFRDAIREDGFKRWEEAGRGLPFIYGDDIRGLDHGLILDVLDMEPGDLDCFEGSPPCKSFSMSGLREDGWGKISHYSDERLQSTHALFDEWTRILGGLQPRSFLAENVGGIGQGNAVEEVMVPLIAEMQSLGYRVRAVVVNMKDLGVPQSRQRMMFEGIRNDQVDENGNDLWPEYPDPFPYGYNVGDALAATEEIGGNPQIELDTANIERYETGKIWRSLEVGGVPANKAYQLIRCHPERPVPTITATSGGNIPAAGPCHPFECRKFTVTEMRFLSGFPFDYEFTGTIEQQGERMGRCVPPFAMKQMAGLLSDVLDRAVEG